MTTALAERPRSNGIQLAAGAEAGMPALSVNQAIERRNALVEYVKRVLKQDLDFGTIAGTGKPTLLKPGAEKLNTLFGLVARYEIVEHVEDWIGAEHGGEPFFYYWFRCLMYRGEQLVAEADGSCNSREKKYRWRWVREHDVPHNVDRSTLARKATGVREPTWAIDRAETTGKFGRPAEYWAKLKEAIANGTAKKTKWPGRDNKQQVGYEFEEVLYRLPNEDVAEQVNTIQKMAQKRALIAATLIAINASEFFTQDVEDMEMIDGARVAANAPVPTGDPADAGDTTIEIDFTDDDVFLSHWDELAAKRELDQRTGREVLGAMIRKRKLDFFQSTADQRVELLDGLGNASDEQVAALKTKQRTDSDKPAAATQANKPADDQQHIDTSESQDDGRDAADAAGVQDTLAWAKQRAAAQRDAALTEAEVGDFNDFMELMVDAGTRREHSADAVLKAVELHAKLLGKEPGQLSSNQRIAAVKAFRAGNFDVNTGKIGRATQKAK